MQRPIFVRMVVGTQHDASADDDEMMNQRGAIPPPHCVAALCFALLGADKPAVVASNAYNALPPFQRDSIRK